MSFCKVTLYGNLGRDPECKTNNNGTQISEFSVAYEDGYKEKAQVNWISVNAFGKTADFCNRYLQKGAAVVIFGKLRVDNYVNKEGQKCIFPRIHADEVHVTTKRENGNNAANRPSEHRPAQGNVQPPGFGRPAPKPPPSNAMPPEFEPPDSNTDVPF